MISTLKSYGISFLLHGMLLVALYAVPAASQRSFSTSGETQVVALQLYQSDPSQVADAVSEIEVERLDLVEPTTSLTNVAAGEPRSLPQQEPDQVLRSTSLLSEPRLPEMLNLDSQFPEREEVSIERQRFVEPTPRIQELDLPRPRAVAHRKRAAVTSQPPVFASAPLKPDAGLEDDASASFSGNAPPAYPGEAIRQGLQGTVVLRLHVSKSGKVHGVEIATSSGHRLLDDAAAQTVAQWTGRPASRWGRPVASIELLPIRFRL